MNGWHKAKNGDKSVVLIVLMNRLHAINTHSEVLELLTVLYWFWYEPHPSKPMDNQKYSITRLIKNNKFIPSVELVKLHTKS